MASVLEVISTVIFLSTRRRWSRPVTAFRPLALGYIAETSPCFGRFQTVPEKHVPSRHLFNFWYCTWLFHFLFFSCEHFARSWAPPTHCTRQ